MASSLMNFFVSDFDPSPLWSQRRGNGAQLLHGIHPHLQVIMPIKAASLGASKDALPQLVDENSHRIERGVHSGLA